MKKRRMLKWSGSTLCLAVAVVLIIPASRYVVFGVVKQEPFEEGRPQSYWIQALKNDDPEVREEALICLARMDGNAADAVPGLTTALDDEVPTIRWRAAFALFKSRRPISAAMPHLLAGLKDEDNMVRFYSAMCLSRGGWECSEVVPELMAAVKDKRNGIHLFQSPTTTRQMAVVAIGSVGPQAAPAVGLLIGLLDDEDLVMRMVAVQALAKIRSADAVPPLVALLKNPRSPLRRDVVLALGAMGPKAVSAAPALRKLIEGGDDQELRGHAMTALCEIERSSAAAAP